MKDKFFQGVDRYVFISKVTLAAGSTFQKIVSATHLAAVGDVIVFTSGPLIGLSTRAITITDANTITLRDNLPFEPTVGVTANVFRRIPKTGEADAWVYNSAADIVDTTPVEAKAATANKRHVVTKIIGSNSDATAGTLLRVLSATTVKAQYPNPADFGGFKDECFEEPIVCVVGEALNIDCPTTSSQSRVTIWGATI